MYACPTCGAGLKFDPKTQKLLCLSCRNNYEPENIEKARLEQAKEIEKKLEQENKFEAISYKCSHCGAELLTTDETITTFCSYCRIGTMLDRKIIEKTKPDYIIPFKITKEECEKIYINKIKKSFFAPKSMIEEQEVSKIRGIYMPYWIYSFEKHGENKTRGSKRTRRSGDYVYYDDYLLKTNIDAKSDGISHDATSNFYDRLSEAIAPFSYKDKKDFSPAYLSGFYADNEDINQEIYLEETRKMASNHLSKLLGNDKIYHKYDAKPSVEFDYENAKLALFPIYFLATNNKNNNRISYAVINGQTGKIAADIPVDFKKFGMFVGVLAIFIFMILNMFLSISMPKLIICSIIFNIISLAILINQNKKIKIREYELDDIGVQSKLTKKEKNKIKRELNNKKKNKKKKNNKNYALIIFLSYISAFLLVYILKKILNIALSDWNKIENSFFNFNNSMYIKMAISAIIILIPSIYVIKKIKMNDKDISIFKPIYGLILTAIVFILRPASDIYYYFAAFISIALTIWSFYNIIEKFNILSTRKLPQLGARGGDENA